MFKIAAKIMLCLSGVFFLTGIALPWIISTDMLPLTLIILIIGTLIAFIMAFIYCIGKKLDDEV